MDPDFIPPACNLDTPGPSNKSSSVKRRCMQPAVDVIEDDSDKDDSDKDDSDDNKEVKDQPETTKRPTKKRRRAANQSPSSCELHDIQEVVHFNDNTNTPGTNDHFFKFWPLFSFLNTAFRRPLRMTSSITQCYTRGKTMLEAHGVPLTPEPGAMGATSQIVSILASTMSSSTNTAMIVHNFFSSLEIVWYLYTGTARDSRIGKPPLRSIMSCGTWNYMLSDDGILAVRWKDNKVVTLLPTDMGVQPTSSVSDTAVTPRRR
ncbi:hypothetical protein L3Q82_020896, partial [Scortum barcoo]